MTDRGKLELIDRMIGDARELSRMESCGNGFFEGVLCAINFILSLKEDNDE